MKIGILGGTFNPIHHGHLLIGSFVYECMGLDKLIFMPAGRPPLKEGQADFYHRYKMVDLAIKGDERFDLTDIENKEEPSYTYNTLKELKSRTQDDLYFIMGADSLESIEKWYRYEDLLRENKIIVVGRKGSIEPYIYIDKYKHLGLKLSICPMPLVEISSTLIRERVRKHLGARYLTPERVCEYIEYNRLYE